MGSVKSAGLSLLLLSFLIYVAESYPNIELSNSKICFNAIVLSTLVLPLEM